MMAPPPPILNNSAFSQDGQCARPGSVSYNESYPQYILCVGSVSYKDDARAEGGVSVLMFL